MPSKARATATTDHDEIRRWADDRGAKPACVRNTGNRDDVGIIRLDFPGYSGEETLQEISWDEWFEKFDDQGLALLHQQTTASGQKSNFNKLVSRETASIAKEKSGRSASASSSRTRSAGTSSSNASRSMSGSARATRDSGRNVQASKSQGRSGTRSTEAKPTAQKSKKVTSIAHKQQAAKSSHPRSPRGRAA